MSKIPEGVARDFMIQQNLKPLEPYPGNHKPWKCECLKCGRQVTPHYSSVQQGRNGCAYCARRKVDPTDALKVMHNAKLGPLAQSVEQRTFNPWVDGSSPSGPTCLCDQKSRFLLTA